GIPGVRLFLDDGTFAITDEQGKYSMYGVAGRTHVLKVDRSTLPLGAELAALSSRNAGDGGSRFIDLKFGEMQKADFALTDCSAAMADELKVRRQHRGTQEELARAVKAQFNTQEVQKDPQQLKSMSASGLVDSANTPVAGRTSAPAMNHSGAQPPSAATGTVRTGAQPPSAATEGSSPAEK